MFITLRGRNRNKMAINASLFQYREYIETNANHTNWLTSCISLNILLHESNNTLLIHDTSSLCMLYTYFASHSLKINFVVLKLYTNDIATSIFIKTSVSVANIKTNLTFDFLMGLYRH